eukprot:CAMPEP_0115834008 /NCGR_PEP_ID=MMETSP0287-20121206/3465_1 /TAXON_ID=412157 /ORGANISM="Chrysochromulina rotalis, Strain UIO044" /LENGTH=76 /DNA_ID=CAMNT_0003287437 /DNA_START=347 /DNA_END=577 /DNA_ORIENTATION=-
MTSEGAVAQQLNHVMDLEANVTIQTLVASAEDDALDAKDLESPQAAHARLREAEACRIAFRCALKLPALRQHAHNV